MELLLLVKLALGWMRSASAADEPGFVEVDPQSLSDPPQDGPVAPQELME